VEESIAFRFIAKNVRFAMCDNNTPFRLFRGCFLNLFLLHTRTHYHANTCKYITYIYVKGRLMLDASLAAIIVCHVAFAAMFITYRYPRGLHISCPSTCVFAVDCFMVLVSFHYFHGVNCRGVNYNRANTSRTRRHADLIGSDIRNALVILVT